MALNSNYTYLPKCISLKNLEQILPSISLIQIIVFKAYITSNTERDDCGKLGREPLLIHHPFYYTNVKHSTILFFWISGSTEKQLVTKLKKVKRNDAIMKIL